MKSLAEWMLILVVATGTWFGVCAPGCGGGSKKVNEPMVGTVGEEEEEDDIDWRSVQLTEAEEREFEEGRAAYQPVASEGKGGSSGAQEGSAEATGTGVGPGTVKIVLKALGKEVPGDVRVIKNDPDQTVVETGKDKSTYVFSLAPGSYNIEAIYREAINEPKLTLTGVEVPAGGKLERTINFPMAQVKFIPVKSGTTQLVKGYKLKLKAKGAENWYPKVIQPHTDFVLISPGNYEGQLVKGEKVIDISNIQINEGAKAHQRIDVFM